MQLNLSIRTLSESLFSGPVERVKLPGQMGSFEIRPGHAPLIAGLTSGEVTYVTGGGIQQVPVQRGAVRVEKNQVEVWLWNA